MLRPSIPDRRPGRGFTSIGRKCGDRFILRAYSPLETIAGGTILDPSPPRRGVRTSAGLARFSRLTESDVDAVMVMVDEAGLAGLPVAHLTSRAGVAWDERQAIVSRLGHDRLAVEIGGLLVSAARVSASEEALVSAVTRYHATHPLEDGMPREEVRERVFARASPQVFDHVMRALTERKRIIARDRVALAGHSVALTDEEARARDAMNDILRESALAPPDPAALAARIGLPLEVVNRIATLLGTPVGVDPRRRSAVSRVGARATQGRNSDAEAQRGRRDDRRRQHRDFKSGNVVLTPDARGMRTVITDFGLARGGVGAERGTLTEIGMVMGTPAYMAPEQVQGRRSLGGERSLLLRRGAFRDGLRRTAVPR